MKKARPTTKADETPEFVAFWRTWQPHMHPNDGRGSARDEFVRHIELRNADGADMADGAAWFIRGRKPGDWMPHAATWLNRCAYEDFCEKERAFKASMEVRQRSNVVSLPPRSTPIGQSKQG